MQKPDGAGANPMLDQIRRTQALAHAEWEALERIIDIQSDGMRRLMKLHNGLGKSQQHRGHGAASALAAPWSAFYQQAFSNAMEASVISMDTIAGIHAEMLKTSHEIIPLLQHEFTESFKDVSRAMSSIPAMSMPAATAKSDHQKSA